MLSTRQGGIDDERLRRQLSLGTLLGVASVLAFVGLSLADAGPIEPVGTTSWNPSTASINTGESVSFRNTSGHRTESPGRRRARPAARRRSSTAAEPAATWKGSCDFDQAGSFPFRCTLHPAMTGTITVSGPEKPAVVTSAATGANDSQATVNGTADPNEQPTNTSSNGAPRDYGGNTPESRSAAARTRCRDGGPDRALGKTTYHFRLFAKNKSGKSEGVDKTFTTSGTPTATTTGSAGLASTKANLQGTVNPFGHATTYFFNGARPTYGQTTSVQALERLEPRFRLGPSPGSRRKPNTTSGSSRKTASKNRKGWTKPSRPPRNRPNRRPKKKTRRSPTRR